jgi:WD40 repeat protein
MPLDDSTRNKYKDRKDLDLDMAPHSGAVNSLALDERTRHLFSGDSVGAIFVWRLDAAGTYQLLRKIRKDDLDGQNIMSLEVHPDRSKSQLMVFAEPSFLKVYNLSTYKPQASFSGAYIQGCFSRASLSADGRYVICGTEDSRVNFSKDSSNSSESIANSYSSSFKPSRIKIWDSQSGNTINSPISKLSFSYSVRSISWNKTQHMVAVASAGPDASVAIFTAEKENALQTIERAEQSAASDLINAMQRKLVNPEEE